LRALPGGSSGPPIPPDDAASHECNCSETLARHRFGAIREKS
jgi:hypothetical protein